MRIIAAIIFLLQSIMLFAQRPTHVPSQSGPVKFFESPANIVFFIVLPILIVFFYAMWRRWVRKNQEENDRQD